ncbi:MAG: cbb3-type cytochrome c oxidase subunit I [Anaerolineales bacterium]|nr:cbb3-type cytochrome c oxidase subunit I [Anaerolineales bacterium]
MNKKNGTSLLSYGLVRGLIGQVIGTLIGLGIVTLVRLIMGLPAWDPEPAWVFGMLLGFIGFLIAIGAFRDWYRAALGETIANHPHDPETWTPLQRYLGFSVDHKVIGIQYGIYSVFLLLTGGVFALIFRLELADPGIQFFTSTSTTSLGGLTGFNTTFSLHGIVMIASILAGVAAMSNYLMPLMIGARDMAFPRLNGLSFWIAVPAGSILLSSMFFGGFDTGWVGYPPLSTRAPLGVQMFYLGIALYGFSGILGSINIIVTFLTMRAEGMTLFRTPVFAWTAFSTALIQFAATQLIGLSFLMAMFQRLFGMGFFDPAKGGDVVLFQHLFWFYSHPVVYVFVLTGLGVISEILPVFSRKPLFGYKWVALSSLGIALVGFFVWAHHMFTSGMAPFLRVPFMVSTLLVAVPTGVKFFSWIATIWQGKLVFPTPMLFALGAVAIFLLGGLSGPPAGTVATDLYIHDTYFIVGHFHSTMFGGYIFPFMAALYYWFPKVTGKMYSERLGKTHFWLMFPAFLVQTLGQMQVGLLGMRRRIADYDPALGIDFSQLLITVAAYLIALAVAIMLYNLYFSARYGDKAADNPWRSRSPEFQVPSPVPVYNFAEPIEVIGNPYDYGLEGSQYTRFKKAEPAPAAAATD